MLRVLVVDDEQNILEIIQYNLEHEGYRVITAVEGNAGLKLALSEIPDLIVLDIMLPELDGYSICRLLRREAKTRHIPIIILSARSDELDKVLGLELGADDYMTKPFSPRELVCRVKARLRRKEKIESNLVQEEQNVIVQNELVLDNDRMLIEYNGNKQYLTHKEFELLSFLAYQQGKVYSRDYLLEQIWGDDFTGDPRTVDVHIRHIRQKIEKLDPSKQYIRTVRGEGYYFK